MIVCVWLPEFCLRVQAFRRSDEHQPLALAALSSVAYPTVMDCNDAARAEGVVEGMLVTRALGHCGELRVMDYDEARIAEAEQRFVVRLEQLGAAVQLLSPGKALFDSAPLERLYDGLDGVLEQVRVSFRRAADLRLGVGPNPFVAQVAARYAAPGQQCLVPEDEVQQVLAPLPVRLLPADDHFHSLCDALGLATLGDFASIDRSLVAERFGDRGVLLWRLAHGDDPAQLQPRSPAEPLVEELQFPSAVSHMHTLRHAIHMLVERAVRRPQCVSHAPHAFTVVAYLEPEGSWQSRRVLREPTLDIERITLAAVVQLDELPAPVERLQLRFDEFALQAAVQPELAVTVEASHNARLQRLQAGVEHVQAAVGDEAVLHVLEVEPWSRIPERHAVLVPHSTSDNAPESVGGGRS